MKTLVIYDSFFGNTEKIALAVGDECGSKKDVVIVKAVDVKLDQLKGIELLIVGSPTRAFRPVKNIMTFLKSIPKGSLKSVKVAAFDTRISLVDVNSKVLNFFVTLFGYAAKPIANRLVKKGGNLAIDPEGFIVKGSEGPPKAGELERAAQWTKKCISGVH